MFTLWIIKLTTRPHYHSSPIISQPWLGSFILLLAAWCEKHYALEKNKGFTSSRAAGLFGHWLWLSYLMASCPRRKVQHFSSKRIAVSMKAQLLRTSLAHSSGATVPMLLPHMVCHWHKGCSVSLLFLTALMSHRFCKKRGKKTALWSVLIALAEPRASVR